MATVASHSDIAQFPPEYSTQFLSELQGILEKAQRFSGATGVAIAFVEGEELVTKSGLGASAPEVGSRSPIQGSFTGLSVQTREVQRCDDASHDTRVDSQACAALGISSMVIVPIGDKSKTFGVLAAFGAKPNAFTPTHVALLRTLADIVVELYNRFPLTGADASATTTIPEPPKPPAKVEQPRPPAVTISEPVRSPIAPPPATTAKLSVPPPARVDIAPRAAAESARATPSVPPGQIKLTEAPVVVPPVHLESPMVEVKREPKVAARPEPPKVERRTEPTRYAPVIEIDAGREKREEVLSPAADIGPVSVQKTAIAAPARVEAPSFSGYGYSAAASADPASEGSGNSRVLVIIAILVVVVGLGATGGYYFLRHPGKTVSAQTTPAPEQLTPAPAPVAAPQPVETNATAAVNTAAASSVEKLPEHVQKFPPQKEQFTVPKEKAPEPKKSAPAPILVAGGGSVPKRVDTENVDAPSVVAGDADASNILGMVKTEQPKAAFKSSSVTPPELVKRVPPSYPPFARQLHLKNERVVLNATIGKDGNVAEVKLVRGKQVFAESAINAVRQWKYKPAYLNGDAVVASIEIDLEFTN